MNSSILRLSLVITIIRFDVVLSGANERRLLNDLMAQYNTLERPVYNESEPLIVSFGLTLQQIIDIDEKNQLLISNVWLNMDEKNQLLISNVWLNFEWIDSNLRWNTSEYGGVAELRIPPSRLWKPDILMYNSADERFDSTFQTNVVVKHNGSCVYIPPGIFKSSCKIDTTWFPFDDQKCEMKFGSWTYDGYSLDLRLPEEGADLSTYIPSGEWMLVGVPAVRMEKMYECCPAPYVDVTFTIHVRRKTLYYGFNLIIPCCLISSITLLGFTLPPESGEKLTLGVTILLSMSVFMLRLSEVLPATSDAVSVIGTYFASIMMMVAFSVVMTVLVLNFHYKASESSEMSPFVKKVLLVWMPWLLRMELPGTVKPPETSSSSPSKKVRRKSGVTVTNSSTNTTGFFDPSPTFAHQQDFHQQQSGSSNYVIPTISTNPKKWIHPSQLRSNALGVGHGGTSGMVSGSNIMMMDILNQRGSSGSKLRLSDQLNLSNSLGRKQQHTSHLITSSDMNYDAIDSLNEVKLNNDHLNDGGNYSMYHHPTSPMSHNPSTSSLHRLNPHLHPQTSSTSSTALHQIHSSNNLHTDCPFLNCPHSMQEHGSGGSASVPASAQVIMLNSSGQQMLDEEGNDESDVDSTCQQIPPPPSSRNLRHHLSGMGMNNPSTHSNLLIPPPPLQSNPNNLCSCESCPVNCLQPLIQSSMSGGGKDSSEEINAILQEMKFLTNRLRREDEVGDIVNEWRGAAMVIDRLCLILFTAFTIVSTLVCITSAPHLIVHG